MKNSEKKTWMARCCHSKMSLSVLTRKLHIFTKNFRIGIHWLCSKYYKIMIKILAAHILINVSMTTGHIHWITTASFHFIWSFVAEFRVSYSTVPDWEHRKCSLKHCTTLQRQHMQHRLLTVFLAHKFCSRCRWTKSMKDSKLSKTTAAFWPQ